MRYLDDFLFNSAVRTYTHIHTQERERERASYMYYYKLQKHIPIKLAGWASHCNQIKRLVNFLHGRVDSSTYGHNLYRHSFRSVCHTYRYKYIHYFLLPLLLQTQLKTLKKQQQRGYHNSIPFHSIQSQENVQSQRKGKLFLARIRLKSNMAFSSRRPGTLSFFFSFLLFVTTVKKGEKKVA